MAGPQTWSALLPAVADGTVNARPAAAVPVAPNSSDVATSDRNTVIAKLKFLQIATLETDLADPAKTRQHLIDLLAATIAHGFTPTITSVNTDHGPDNIPSMGGLTNHGHTNGWAVDVFVDAPIAAQFIHDCLFANLLVTKIGLGGVFQSQNLNGLGDHSSSADDEVVNGKVVFADNETNHIHLQTK